MVVIILLLLVVIVFQWQLHQSVKENGENMATQADVNALNEHLTRVEGKLDEQVADTQALKDELKALNENANVDLGPAIARLEKMEARLTTNVGPNIGSDPETPADTTGVVTGEGA